MNLGLKKGQSFAFLGVSIFASDWNVCRYMYKFALFLSLEVLGSGM